MHAFPRFTLALFTLILLTASPFSVHAEDEVPTAHAEHRKIELGEHYIGKTVPMSYEYTNTTEEPITLKIEANYLALTLKTKQLNIEPGEKAKIIGEIKTNDLKRGGHLFSINLINGEETELLEVFLDLKSMYIITPKRMMLYDQAKWRGAVRVSPAIKGLEIDKVSYKVRGLKHTIENLPGICKVHLQAGPKSPVGPYKITVTPKDTETYPVFTFNAYPMKGLSYTHEIARIYKEGGDTQIYISHYDRKTKFKILGVKSPYRWLKASVKKAGENAYLIELKITAPKKAITDNKELIIATSDPHNKQIRIPVIYQEYDSWIGK